jgi:hypothetical protein
MVRSTDKRIFTAYSDFSAGEVGTIYQACNFDYLGRDFGTNKLYTLPDGRKVSGRYFTKTSTMRKWAAELGLAWDESWVKANGYQDYSKIPEKLKIYARKKQAECPATVVEPKGKYVLLLNYGKQKLTPTWTKVPYPKRIKY